jgi:hypothetical protein
LENVGAAASGRTAGIARIRAFNIAQMISPRSGAVNAGYFEGAVPGLFGS